MAVLSRLRRAIADRTERSDPERALSEHELERRREEARVQAERHVVGVPPPPVIPPGSGDIGSIGGGF